MTRSTARLRGITNNCTYWLDTVDMPRVFHYSAFHYVSARIRHSLLFEACHSNCGEGLQFIVYSTQVIQTILVTLQHDAEQPTGCTLHMSNVSVLSPMSLNLL